MPGDNVHDINTDELALEAEALAGSAPPSSSPAFDAPDPATVVQVGSVELTPDQVHAIAARNAGAMIGLVGALASGIAPNWQIDTAEVAAIGNAAANALAAWFPDGALPYKYWVLLELGGTVLGVANARKDPATGKLRPLKAPQNGAAAAA
jgi:hypothetical protein